MLNDSNILSSIKNKVQNVVPDATVMLFGSRAYGIPTTESDWDILILTSAPVNAILKKNIQFSVFPLSVQIGAFISILTVQQDDWVNNASYYSLRQNIGDRLILL